MRCESMRSAVPYHHNAGDLRHRDASVGSPNTWTWKSKHIWGRTANHEKRSNNLYCTSDEEMNCMRFNQATDRAN
jgi:hypothetical protein